MFIIGRTGKTYARLSFNAGPGGSTLLSVSVDWPAWPQVLMEQQPPLSELFQEWMNEFDRNIHPYQPSHPIISDNLEPSGISINDWWESFQDLAGDRLRDELDQLEPADMIASMEVGYDPAD
jgi:hypothetical protein